VLKHVTVGVAGSSRDAVLNVLMRMREITPRGLTTLHRDSRAMKPKLVRVSSDIESPITLTFPVFLP